MNDTSIIQMPAFKRAYKKLHKEHKLLINQAILNIVNDPSVGEEKKGDLSGVFVYKFKVFNQEFLLAYEWDPSTRILLTLGVHENFYRDLKKSL